MIVLYRGMHVAAMRYLRYSLNLPLVCTEVGGWNADIFGASKTRLVEVEIKKSLSDLKAEFKNKKEKHSYYRNVESPSAPKYFYFCLPEHLVEKAQSIIEEGFPEAGILLFSDEASIGYVYLHKKAKALHNNAPSDTILNSMILRMSSELTTLRTALDEVLRSHYEQIQGKLEGSLTEMSLLYGTDLASEVAERTNHHPRVTSLAMRLAEALDGVDSDAWFELDSKSQKRYRDAAMKLVSNGKETFGETIKKRA